MKYGYLTVEEAVREIRGAMAGEAGNEPTPKNALPDLPENL
jgi:hypothetical protein